MKEECGVARLALCLNMEAPAPHSGCSLDYCGHALGGSWHRVTTPQEGTPDFVPTAHGNVKGKHWIASTSTLAKPVLLSPPSFTPTWTHKALPTALPALPDELDLLRGFGLGAFRRVYGHAGTCLGKVPGAPQA